MDTKKSTIRNLVIPIEHYPHLSENQTLQEAIQSFMSFRAGQQERQHYSMLFVVNDLNQLVGKLFLMDIMHGLAPGLLKGTKVGKFEGKEGDFLDLAPLYETSTFSECGKNRDKPIKSLVHPIDFSFPADTHILKALVMMSNRNEFDVPVTDDGTIIGVLRLEEIFMAMCNTYCPIP
ncbi:CBS domain-containing protein [Desulfopila sp. IMCC35006]|uniref:CBS domain-containing protein n=1 Tax=Desulfopila sp. IMCC35006 TaxID=2569542 RepID=UPI0010AC4AD9|nr:CBS domain-containing protein [Desulfopila sp. IMCC35006]TKB24403.1 CBS domain-containing protein [Desulfopila sp. IMCC35006]